MKENEINVIVKKMPSTKAALIGHFGNNSHHLNLHFDLYSLFFPSPFLPLQIFTFKQKGLSHLLASIPTPYSRGRYPNTPIPTNASRVASFPANYKLVSLGISTSPRTPSNSKLSRGLDTK